jgi:N6-L-threonylcarbamoyladenine synthase
VAFKCYAHACYTNVRHFRNPLKRLSGLHTIRTSRTGNRGDGFSGPRMGGPEATGAIYTLMIVLGIETTCDETAAAVVERDAEGQGRILSNVVWSQISEHAAFGGVVPEIAARAHVEVLDSIIAKAMSEAQVPFSALDGIAAAAGPGLIGGVIVGLTMAKAIAFVHGKPLIAVNHLEAHALTARLTDATAFPYCLFLASGGHTQILGVRGVGNYLRIGGTVDDAIGEAFDKTAKLLGLGYPGGPLVEKEAARGDAERFSLPRPMSGRNDANFSLSGLKTALRLEAAKIAPLSDDDVADLCASFQQAIGEVVMDRLRNGLRIFREQIGTPTALVCAGGVAANQAIRKVLHRVAFEIGISLVAPPPVLCTDNGAMIAWAGAERLALGLIDSLEVAPRARWPLNEVTKAAG